MQVFIRGPDGKTIEVFPDEPPCVPIELNNPYIVDLSANCARIDGLGIDCRYGSQCSLARIELEVDSIHVDVYAPPSKVLWAIVRSVLRWRIKFARR